MVSSDWISSYTSFGELMDRGLVEIPARYIMAFMSFMAIAVQYMLSMNLSVVIVQMVKHRGTCTVSKVCRCIYYNISSELPYSGELDWDESDRAQALSSYYYGYLATQLLGGWAAERWSARYLCGSSLLAAGLISLAAPSAAQAGLPAFIITRASVGAASGIVVPSIHRLVANWLTPKERTQLTGLIFSAPCFGSLVAMSVSGALVGSAHWSMSFYLFGGVTIIWFIPWMFLIYDSPTKHTRISQIERSHILIGLGEKENGKKVALPVPWGKLLTSVPVWTAILFHAGVAWLMFTLSSELPTYLSAMMQLSIKTSGALSAVPYLFAWISGSFFGFLSQWLRDKGWLTRLQAYKVFNGIVACTALYGGSCLNHMDLARNFSGTIAGLLHTVLTLTGILTPITVGALTEHNDTLAQWNKVFYIAAALSVITFLLYLVFGSVDEQPWNVPQETAHIESNRAHYTEQERNIVPEEVID